MDTKMDFFNDFLFHLSWDMNMDCFKKMTENNEFDESDFLLTSDGIQLMRINLPCGEELCNSCYKILISYTLEYMKYINDINTKIKKRKFTAKKACK